MTGDDGRLDRLLSTPLAPVEDAGFSARVIARISPVREGRSWVDEAIFFAAAGLILAIAASTPFPRWIGSLGSSLATSLPLATAALALALSLAYARLAAE